jgi:outer membrane lipoprotein-sorting protein
MECAESDTQNKKKWKEVLPHRAEVLLEDVDVFKDHLVFSERTEGLTHLRIRRLSDGREHEITFNDPAYMAYTGTNPEWDTDKLRYGYTSMTTPSSVLEHDLNEVGEDILLKQQEVLGSTPAALIAAGTDLKALSEVFDLKAAPAQDGLDWLEARPKAKDGQLQSVRVGFRAGQLAVLEIADSLGQRSVLTFNQWQGNAPLKAEQFRFTPPAGADVIRP